MDYLTQRDQRSSSFREFMDEWIIDQFLRMLEEAGLSRPWYWDLFLDELESCHHMIYASAYTYRATLWFSFVLPLAADAGTHPSEPVSRQWRSYLNSMDLEAPAVASLRDDR
jgi:hypothetical protein